MLRSPYDTDCLSWSPQGRLFQIEYAMEAIKQGSLCVALRSSTHAVLATLNRSPSALAEHQQKLYKIDDHLALCFSGLTADGRLICKFLRTEALNHKYTYGEPYNPGRLLAKLAEKAQLKTHRPGKRPYGVGCLIAGVDENGAHIYDIMPDATFNEYYAAAIGARNQSAKTYLENNFENFANESEQQMIMHAIKAVKVSAQAETELNGKSISVGVAGPEGFRFVEEEEINKVLRDMEQGMQVEA